MQTTDYVISLENTGGLLDSCLLSVPEGRDDGPDIAQAVINMIREAGSLSEGDRISIRLAA